MAASAKTAKLIRREEVGPLADLYTFALPAGHEGLGFVGGQYVILNTGAKDSAGNDIKRAYSIFSADVQQNIFDLCIQRLPNGLATTALRNMREGADLNFSGPWGKFIKDPEWPAAGSTVLLATDSGITAIVGLLQAQKFAISLPLCHALWLTSESEQILSLPKVLARLPAEFRGFSMQTIAPPGTAGRVEESQQLLQAWLDTLPPTTNAFLAGDGRVLNLFRDLLRQHGARDERIGIEPFFNKVADPPAPEMVATKLREGFTTGACSAAAAKAATRVLVRRQPLTEIETTLPNKKKVTFQLKRCEFDDQAAVCSVIKDAGDDPDCTHGAELTAQVHLTKSGTINLHGGDGVATVTKAGLGLEVGQAAINPVPRKNISEMVAEELSGSSFTGADVTISVPGGQEMSKQTMNERLGLLGGISILGTTGIVRPYSTAAYKASVVQGISLAKEQGSPAVVLTTGGKSEKYAMDLFPELDPLAFIQVGDFIGTAVRAAAHKKIGHVIIVGMMGKLSKMADGIMMTHRAGSEVNMKMLADTGRGIGIPEHVCQQIEVANTARHALEICAKAGFPQITSTICQKVAVNCTRYAGGNLRVSCYLVDFEGALLGRYQVPI